MIYAVYDSLEYLSIDLTDLNLKENIVTCLSRQQNSNIDDLINDIEKRFRKYKYNFSN